MFSAQITTIFFDTGRSVDINFAEELVNNIDAPIFIHRNTGRQHVEAGARVLAALAHKHKQLGLVVEYLEVAKSGIDHINISIRIGRDAFGSCKVSNFSSNGAKAEFVRAIRIKGLYAEIAAIGYVDGAIGGCGDLQGQIKLTIFAAASANGFFQFAGLGVENIEVVLLRGDASGVDDIGLQTIGAYGNT